MRWSLTGSAAQLLWGAERLSYEELLEKLRCRYSGKGMEEKFQTELRCRRRHRGESLRELAQDIRRLMTLAYPGERSGLAEHIARDIFLTALNDPEFELKIREREPVDLDEALKLAQRFEVFKSAVQSSSSRDRSTRHIADTGKEEAPTVETRIAALEKELSNLRAGVKGRNNIQSAMGTETQQASEERVAELSAEVDALNKEVGRLHHLEQLRNSNFGFITGQSECNSANRSKAKQKACFQCGQPGHFVRNCPQQHQVEQDRLPSGRLGERRRQGFASRMCGKNLRDRQLRPSIWTYVSMDGIARVCWIPVVT